MALLICVVDDDEASREAIAGLVRSLGHRAAEFTDAAGFLASHELETADVVIVDINMPGMSGLELHRRLVAKNVAPAVVLVTAHPSEMSRDRARAAGVADYIPKPVTSAELAGCLDRLPTRGSP